MSSPEEIQVKYISHLWPTSTIRSCVSIDIEIGLTLEEKDARCGTSRAGQARNIVCGRGKTNRPGLFCISKKIFLFPVFLQIAFCACNQVCTKMCVGRKGGDCLLSPRRVGSCTAPECRLGSGHSHSPNSLWSLNDAGVKLAFRSIERPCPVQPLAGCAAGGSLGHCSVVSHGAAAVKQQLDVSLLAVTVQQKSAPQPYVRHRPALIARHLY